MTEVMTALNLISLISFFRKRKTLANARKKRELS